MSQKFLRRSLLYIPGSSQKMVDKAAGIRSDAVIFDLEDAVSITEKASARQIVREALPKLKQQKKEIIVRINSMGDMWSYKDLLELTGLLPDALILPKADERSIITLDTFLGAAEKDLGLAPDTIKLIPLFETAYAITNAFKILGTASRIDGVQLGAEDLTKDLGIVRCSDGSDIAYARSQVAMAACARKIDILDTPFTGIHDLEGLREDCERAKAAGFTGKTCIHPLHIETINEVFSPTEQEAEQAAGIVNAYEESLKAGNGACMYQNKMVDAPVAERARRIVEKAARIQEMLAE